MIDNLNIVVFSDIHLFNKRNKTTDILKALKESMSWSEHEIPDLLIFSGDVFDRLVDLAHDDITEVMLWIFQLLHYCERENIVIRILEGTPSHDWGQSKMFIDLACGMQFSGDIKYVNELSIEYIKKFDTNILYIPDEWENSTNETLEQVKELIYSKGLSQVDFCVMHGNFDFQLPSHIKKIPRHDSSEYIRLVKYFTFIGHIHKHSKLENIIAPGSFDRLAHGEEEPKGYIRAIITLDSKEVFLIENKLAKEYKTVNCCNMSLEETLEHITKEIKYLSDNAYVRIEADNDNPIFTNMVELVKIGPTITWSKLARVEIVEEVSDETTEDFEQLIINKDNIIQLVLEKASLKFNEEQVKCALIHLQEIVHA